MSFDLPKPSSTQTNIQVENVTEKYKNEISENKKKQWVSNSSLSNPFFFLPIPMSKTVCKSVSPLAPCQESVCMPSITSNPVFAVLQL